GPGLHKPVPDADIPQQLSRLQLVRFDNRGLARPLAELAEALRLDLDWIREHTRLGELAARWLARGKPESLLLRGDDLDAAKAWSAKPAAQVLAVTDLQRAFIGASDKADAVRCRSALRMRLVVGVLLAGVCAGLAYAAWSNEDYLRVRLVLLSDLVSPKMLAPAAERALRP